MTIVFESNGRVWYTSQVAKIFISLNLITLKKKIQLLQAYKIIRLRLNNNKINCKMQST